jgi:hypothetical protein
MLIIFSSTWILCINQHRRLFLSFLVNLRITNWTSATIPTNLFPWTWAIWTTLIRYNEYYIPYFLCWSSPQPDFCAWASTEGLFFHFWWIYETQIEPVQPHQPIYFLEFELYELPWLDIMNTTYPIFYADHLLNLNFVHEPAQKAFSFIFGEFTKHKLNQCNHTNQSISLNLSYMNYPD